MNLLIHTKSPLILAGILTVSISLTGCGGGGGGGSKSSAAASSKPASSVAPSSLAASSAPASSNAAESSVPANTSSTPASSISSAAPSSVAASSTPASSSSSAASVNILANLIQNDGGLFGYNADSGVVNRSELVGNATQTYERYNGSAFVSVVAGNADYAYVLTADGWVRGSNAYKVKSFNADGTITTSNVTAWDIGNTLHIDEELDLTGRNVVEFLESYPNTEDMLATINPAATFSSGAKAFVVEHKNDDRIYSIYIDEGRDDGKCWWEGGDPVSDSGGNCMAVNMTVDVNTLEKAVSGYDKLFSTDVAINTAGYRAVILGQVGPNNLEMQVINNAQKTVKFYENLPNGNFTKLITTGTWSEITLPYLTTDNKALYVDLPEAVELHLHSLGTTEVTFAQQNGHLRPIGYSDPEKDENISFNVTANTNITTATTNYKNPLVGNWNAGTSDIFIFSNNNTFVHVKAESDDPDNCYVGSAIGTYSWNPDTTELKVKLGSDSTASEDAGSCSIGGESKIRLDGTSAIVFESEEGDEYRFAAQAATSGLVGTWVGKSDNELSVLVFTGTQFFLSSYRNIEGTGIYETESGTYTYNSGTGMISVTVIKDVNAETGFSVDNDGPLSVVIGNSGATLTIDQGSVFTRLQ